MESVTTTHADEDVAPFTNIARRYFDTFVTANRHVAEGLLADDFTFTSPQDDHIDRAGFFERCWPIAGTLERIDFLRVAVDGDHGFVQYEITPKQGRRFRNTEILQLDGDRIRAIDVYFGRSVE